MALITREIVTEKLGAYLRHDLSLAESVSWAESALMKVNSTPPISPRFGRWLLGLVSPTCVHLDWPGKIVSNFSPYLDTPLE